jgi:hypothetical protein
MPAGLPVAPKHLHLDRFEVSRRSPAFPELHDWMWAVAPVLKRKSRPQKEAATLRF